MAASRPWPCASAVLPLSRSVWISVCASTSYPPVKCNAIIASIRYLLYAIVYYGAGDLFVRKNASIFMEKTPEGESFKQSYQLKLLPAPLQILHLYRHPRAQSAHPGCRG